MITKARVETTSRCLVFPGPAACRAGRRPGRQAGEPRCERAVARIEALARYSQASQGAGWGPVEPLPPGDRGAGDIPFVAPHLPGIDGLGVSGRGAHSPDEELEIASIERATIRAARLLYRLTR